MTESLEPGLHLVATPLGNLGDFSPRARETISRASFIAAESSQVLKRLLQIVEHPGSSKILSYRESSRERDSQKILAHLEEGRAVVLVSDAGTPTISDPGWQLVDQVRQAGHTVHAIPGPCAGILALSMSGFPSRRFTFEGFLAQGGRVRREALQRISDETTPIILYESPHRLLSTLKDLRDLNPQRQIFVTRELTKKFEETWRGSLAEACEHWSEKLIKGEFTLVLGILENSENPEQTVG